MNALASKAGPSRAPRGAGALAIILIVAAALPGCGTNRVAQENDRLRERVLVLEHSLEQVRWRNAELAAELQAVQPEPQPGASTDAISAAIRENTPHVIEIQIERMSHARDTNGDGRLDMLLLYLQSKDSRRRFVQMVGELRVHAAVLPDQGDAVTIGQISLGPAELRDAYRASILGTHYTVQVPLDLSGVRELPPTTAVRVVYWDGRGRFEREAQRMISLKVAGGGRLPDPTAE